jgi:hypothetical protein
LIEFTTYSVIGDFFDLIMTLPRLLLLSSLLLLIIPTSITFSNTTTAAYAHLYNNMIQTWTDIQNNLKIQFSYLPEQPTMDDILQLQFSIQNLQTGNHLKNLIARVTVTNNPLYKFDNITIANGDFSIRCPFLDPGMHQVIIKVDSKDYYSLALASFKIPVSNMTMLQ